MHHTQDKEFDQLFKDRFEEAQWEPSPGLWDNIDQQLHPATKKRRLWYWIPAAAVLLLVGAAMLWLGKTEKIRLSAPLAGQPSVVTQPAVEKNIKEPKTAVVKQEEALQPVALKEDKKLLAVQTTLETKATTPEQQLEAIVPVSKAKQLEMDVPKEKPVLAMGKTEDSIPAQDAEMLNQPDQVINENAQAHKKGIRNLGDLINFVVDKVDKREQKLLKFKTDDDDQSALVAVNIGFIKFNSKKHK